MVTFETKCYENDWALMLKTNYLKTMIERCNYNFDKKVVLLNNIFNMEEAENHAKKLVLEGVIDEYFIVDNYAEKALNFLNIKKESFNGGYYYSIAELVGIYTCETDFLVHFSSDSMMDKNNINWINETIKIFNKYENIFVATAVWDFRFEEAKLQSFFETENWFFGQGFSDQCYMIRSEDFKKPIYNEKNPISERYPSYGGELFEKRVDSFMRNHNLMRITNKNCSYIHKNIPRGHHEDQLKHMID